MYNGEKSSDWKHLQFSVFMHFFIKVKKHVPQCFFICESMFLTSAIYSFIPSFINLFLSQLSSRSILIDCCCQISMYEDKMARLKQEQRRLQKISSQNDDEVA